MLAALGLSACLWIGTPALAQQAQIDDATITSIRSLDPNQVQQITQYVEQPLRDMAGDDPVLVGQARNRLIEPLETPAIGVPFRLAYANATAPELERLARSETELTAINALRVLGELATDRTSLAIEEALNNPGVGVRYTAVYCVGRTFDAVASEAPAVAPQRVDALMDRLAELIRNEEDTWVLDVAVRALVAAGSIDQQNFQNTRARAFELLGEAVSGRVRTLPAADGGAEHVQFMLRAAVAMRDALSDTRSLPAPGANAAAGMGGDTYAWIAERLRNGGADVTPEEREVLFSTARSAQAAIHFAYTVHNGDPPQPGSVPDPRNPENDEAFVRFVVAELARLEERGNPFGFETGRFQRP